MDRIVGHSRPPRHSAAPQRLRISAGAAIVFRAAASTACFGDHARPTQHIQTPPRRSRAAEDDQSPGRSPGQRSITQPRPAPTAIPAMNSLDSLSAWPSRSSLHGFGLSFPSRLSGRLVARDASRSRRRRSRSSSRPPADAALSGAGFRGLVWPIFPGHRNLPARPADQPLSASKSRAT